MDDWTLTLPADPPTPEPVTLGDLLASLTGTPTPFAAIATAHPRASAAGVRAGLLQLQEQGSAFLEYGAGWYRKLSHVEQLAVDLPCEQYAQRYRDMGYSCLSDDWRAPASEYAGDRYCDPCRLRYAIELDRKEAQ